MSENREGVEIKPHSKRKLSVKTKALNIAGSVLAGAALGLAADHEAKPVSAAQDNTSTPVVTPARTPTPDARATRIAGTQTAQVAEIDFLQKEKTTTALSRQIDILRGTPPPSASSTPAPTLGPDVVTIDRKELNTLIDKGVDIGVNAKLTAIASERAVADAKAESAAERQRRGNQGDGGGPPGILGFLTVLGLGVAGALGIEHRNRVGGWMAAARNRIPAPVRAGAAAALHRLPVPVRRVLHIP